MLSSSRLWQSRGPHLPTVHSVSTSVFQGHLFASQQKTLGSSPSNNWRTYTQRSSTSCSNHLAMDRSRTRTFGSQLLNFPQLISNASLKRCVCVCFCGMCTDCSMDVPIHVEAGGLTMGVFTLHFTFEARSLIEPDVPCFG